MNNVNGSGFLKVFMKNKNKLYFSLREYLWKRKFDYMPDPQTVDMRWKTVCVHGTITVAIDMLLAAICTENGNIRVPVKQTQHYRWIKSLIDGVNDPVSRGEYIQYNKTFQSGDVNVPENVELWLDHMTAQVLQYKTNPDELKSIAIVTGAPKRKLYVGPYTAKIYDGVHRACIMRAFGYKTIRCLVK